VWITRKKLSDRKHREWNYSKGIGKSNFTF
jgi:hypothetical protein